MGAEKVKLTGRNMPRFRFSVAATLICILAFSVLLAPVCRRYHALRQRTSIIRASGGTIIFDWGYESFSDAASGPWAPSWCRQLFGDELFADPVCVHFHNDQLERRTLDAVAQLSSVNMVVIYGCKLNERDLKFLCDMPQVSYLKIERSNLSGKGLRYLENLRELTYLSLSENHISNSSLQSLAALGDLRELHLDDNPISSEGLLLVGIEHMRSLKRLDVAYTSVDDEVLEQIEELPNLRLVIALGTHVTVDAANRFMQKHPTTTVAVD